MDPSTTEARISELESIRRQTNFWRWGSGAAMLGTMVTCVSLLYSDAHALATPGPTQQAFVNKLQANLNENVVPRLKQTASTALSEMQPVVQKEFSALNTRVPDITQASLKEIDALQKSLPERASKTLNETFDKALRGKEAEIKTMFPNVTEEQVGALFNNLSSVAQERTQAVASDLIAPHVASIGHIRANLEKIAHSEKGNADTGSDWEMGLAVFDVVRTDLKHISPDHKNAAHAIAAAATDVAEAAGHVKKQAEELAQEKSR